MTHRAFAFAFASASALPLSVSYLRPRLIERSRVPVPERTASVHLPHMSLSQRRTVRRAAEQGQHSAFCFVFGTTAPRLECLTSLCVRHVSAVGQRGRSLSFTHKVADLNPAVVMVPRPELCNPLAPDPHADLQSISLAPCGMIFITKKKPYNNNNTSKIHDLERWFSTFVSLSMFPS